MKTFKSLQQIQEEIKNYPTPVDHNDIYFDFLLSERDRLTKETPWLTKESTDGDGRRIIMEMELIDEENAPEHTHGGGGQSDYEYDEDEQ